MKKKIIYATAAIFICATISVLIEVLFFNFKTLTLNESDYSVTDTHYTTQKSNDNNAQIKLDVNEKYIRELVIEYSTTEDIDYKVSYTYSGAYGQNTEEEFTDIFDSTFNIAAINIDKTVSQLTISFDNSKKMEINKIIIDNDFHFNYYRTLFIFLSLITVCSLFYFYKEGFHTEKTHIYFAVICSLLGLMIIIAQPAMNYYCWDDQTHFDRVVDLPIGTTEYNNGEYNMSDGTTANHTWHESTNSFTEHRNRSSFLNSQDNSSYIGNKNGNFLFIHKLPYIPMATGYHLAKLIGFPFTICFQIGKIFNLLFYVLLITYAIKTIVVGKRLLAVIALIPTNIFLASEYSYDPAVFAGVTIFIVQIINLFLDKSNKTKFNFKTAVIMIASMTYACLAKAVYAPFLLLVLLVPKNKFRNAKQSHLVKTGFVIITILLGGTLLLSALDGVNASDSRGGETSVIKQAALIIKHPSDYASVMHDTAVDEFNYKLFSSNTLINFAYTKTPAEHNNFYYIVLFLIIFVFLTDNTGNTLTKKQRLSFLAITILVIALIWSALYLCFTPIGLATINGVQNRYFLPLLLPILFCLQIPSIQNKIKQKYYNATIFILISIMMIFMTYNLILIPYNF